MPAARRVAHVETMRGLACLLLVAFHVVGNNASEGLALTDRHPLRITMEALNDTRMPLFAFISGFVFRFPKEASWPRLMVGKARRLLIPMVVVGTVFYLVKAAVEGPLHMPLWQIYVLPFAHYWFLQAAFLCMAFTAGLAICLKDGSYRPAAILFIISSGVYIATTSEWKPDVFSTWRAVYIMPYFSAGYMISRSAGWSAQLNERLKLITAALLLAIIPLEVWLASGNRIDVHWRHVLAIGAGLTVCVALYSWRWSARPLIAIGASSYAIFLLHVFFASAARRAMDIFWPDAPSLLTFAFGFGVGVAGPILAEKVILLHPASRLLILGLRPTAQPRTTAIATAE